MERSVKFDLTGQRFGRLTAVSTSRVEKRIKWLCQCDCGKQTLCYASHLRNGAQRSCGCLASEKTAARNVATAKHGMWKSAEFRIWTGMIQRCHDANSPGYKNYGARGIRVCDEWREDFKAFYEHVGPRPSPKHSMDRFPDNDGNYEPGNVRWATPDQQANNKRTNVFAEVHGERLTAVQIARRYGLNQSMVERRIHSGKTGLAIIAPSNRGRYRREQAQRGA